MSHPEHPNRCETCGGRGWYGSTPICPDCDGEGYRETVGPFPQEPALGTPEAVAEAAQVLQNPPSGVGLAEDQEISAGLRSGTEASASERRRTKRFGQRLVALADAARRCRREAEHFAACKLPESAATERAWARAYEDAIRERVRSVVLVLLLGLLAAGASAQSLTGPAVVVDGDTLKLGAEKVRMHGIDAPEKDQTCQRANGAAYHCGLKALLALEDFIGGRPVTCSGTERDRYKRLVGRCSVAGVDLSAWMVAQGWAVAYTRYSKDYLPQERVARGRRAGLWVGTFQQPSEWRREH